MPFAKLSPSTLAILGMLPIGWLSLTACNALTGVDDIYLTDDMGDIAGATAQTATSSATGGDTTGQGGASAASVGSTGAATSGAGGMTTATTGMAAATSSGSGAGPCQYPAGPYGVGQGQTVPPNLSWQGYAPGASSPSTISIQQFFDCDGAKG
ncbi:MAG: hypothetical protein VB934_01655, partial [Polyangiaceae bacterium]